MTPRTRSARPASPLLHPTLAPHAVVLRRREHEWQVGIDPDRSVVLSGAGFAAVLAELDRSTPMTTVRAVGRRAGLTVAVIENALDALAAAGLLVQGRRSLPSRHPPGSRTVTAPVGPDPEGLRDRSVRLIGAGPIGSRLAAILVAAGLGVLHVWDDNPPEPDDYPQAGVLATRAEALRSMLTPPGAGLVEPISHWTKPNDSTVDLTVVSADGPEVDRVVTEHLVRIDAPHLLVRSLGPAAIVGPLVLPGHTSCVHCADLTRRDADPCWPALLDQLGRTRLDPDPPVTAWAAATGATQALAFLHRETPELAGATLELSAPAYATRLRSWPAHRACGCTWPGPTEWGA